MINFLIFALWILSMCAALYGVFDCSRRRADAFPAVNRQNKLTWIIFMTMALIALIIFGPISLIGIVAIVLVVFYLVDVRARVIKVAGGASAY